MIALLDAYGNKIRRCRSCQDFCVISLPPKDEREDESDWVNGHHPNCSYRYEEYPINPDYVAAVEELANGRGRLIRFLDGRCKNLDLKVREWHGQFKRAEKECEQLRARVTELELSLARRNQDTNRTCPLCDAMRDG